MAFAIAEAERQTMMETVKSAQFLSVISDGATDSSHQEAEICYIRTAIECKSNVFFIGIENVARADAVGITTALTAFLTSCFQEEWKQKLVRMATDGASVMLGIKNGLVQKMKVEASKSQLLWIHCSNHRLELAYRDAYKKLPLYTKIATLMTNIYFFYRNSPLNRSNLKESFKACALPVLVPTKVIGTRWLPHTERGQNSKGM